MFYCINFVIIQFYTYYDTMPKRKKYFICSSCKSKHIKPIDEGCPFMANNEGSDLCDTATADTELNVDNVNTGASEGAHLLWCRLTNIASCSRVRFPFVIEQKVAQNASSLLTMKNVGGATHTASPASQQSHKQVPGLPS